MKNQVVRIFLTLSLNVLLAVASLYGQSAGSSLVVNIPFKFFVADRTLPAGEYVVESSRVAPSFLVIRSTDGRTYVTVATIAAQAPTLQGGPKLLFNRYGDQYFLSRVWAPSNNFGYELLKSRVERGLVRAMLPPRREVVTGHQR